MAIVTWTPDPAEPLFSLPETATNINYLISATATDDLGAPLPVSNYRYTLSPTPAAPVLTITAGANGVNVTAASLAGLFGIVFIDYLLHGTLGRVFTWDDLPAEAEEIIEFRPLSDAERQYTLTVEADVQGEGTVQAAYTLEILQDWTAGRDRLVEEVNARRD